ncbi:bifunctional glutamate N-acetyltransferase/amino-acid acetyltransferase ArgJ [Agarilytica rhodophyticola]|uniref:bifunctional glutamate N-acetyltransferase/amino-acid acetyltransferase ArgJ n=1 Tax=Agarilytica rhodophyticola TaxID=1737490 RepID=UPI000B345A05|nr:bifunctional glutamate N-acetyltransferase/amino-acid acetyltransferase ArgJ [Agarilytica rhodophyticola]
MAVGNSVWPEFYPIKGVKLGVGEAGIKYSSRKDLALVVLDEGCEVAGVFTQNAYAAAPVDICRKHLGQNKSIRALVINSGNANACTGIEGVDAALRCCDKVAQLTDIEQTQVLPFSTGVIGELLPFEKIEAALPAAYEALSENNWLSFAQAIMTTDTRPKGASKQIEWQGQTLTISGVAKGAGMINPNMATMLAFIATDAPVSSDILDKLSRVAAQQSFNRITIDGDTSTNDACILIATGKAELETIEAEDTPLFNLLKDAVIEVYQSLAQQIVKDGEGATKFVKIEVMGGRDNQESLNVAYAVAHSPLIKTALFASDPNWGRIVAAVGYADVNQLDASKVRIWIDNVLIVENGGRAASYMEEDGQKVFNQEEFSIRVDLGRGDASELLWTSDLSHEYVRINAEYRS